MYWGKRKITIPLCLEFKSSILKKHTENFNNTMLYKWIFISVWQFPIFYFTLGKRGEVVKRGGVVLWYRGISETIVKWHIGTSVRDILVSRKRKKLCLFDLCVYQDVERKEIKSLSITEKKSKFYNLYIRQRKLLTYHKVIYLSSNR